MTFFYELFWGFDRIKWRDFEAKQEKGSLCNCVSEQMFTDIQKKITEVLGRMDIRGGLHANFWFKKVLWATSSAAIHSIIQTDDYRKNCDKRSVKHLIGIDDNPLAYLGLLVDLLQEWDRYTVSRESTFSGTEPLQSIEVKLSCSNNKIKLNYPADDNGKNWAKEVKDNLDKCLDNWTAIVSDCLSDCSN